MEPAMNYNPDDKPFCVFCGAEHKRDHECDPIKLEQYIEREKAHLMRMFERVFDPDFKRDAARNGDTPTRIERLMSDYGQG
jgi:hypothetical protein